MKRPMAIWLILFLSLSLGNAVSVIAHGGCGRCEEEIAAFRPLRGLQEKGRGRQEHPDRRDAIIREERILRYLEENQPGEFERLTCLRERDPGEYRIALRRLGKRIRGKRFLEDLMREDPERYEKVLRIKELERESRQLAEKYREINDPAEKETARADLQELLSELFDLRQKGRETLVERLERKLERLQEKIIRRRENKEAIINRRLKEITGEIDYLRW